MGWLDAGAAAVAPGSISKAGARRANEVLWTGDKFPGGAPERFHGPTATGVTACLDDASLVALRGLVGYPSGRGDIVDMPVESGMGWGRAKPARQGDGTPTQRCSDSCELNTAAVADGAGMLTSGIDASLCAPLGPRSKPRSPNVTTLGGPRLGMSETNPSASLGMVASAAPP